MMIAIEIFSDNRSPRAAPTGPAIVHRTSPEFTESPVTCQPSSFFSHREEIRKFF
jgi:hypothetical protein